MMTSVNLLDSGIYEVTVYLRDGNGDGRWERLRNFLNQGDARVFAYEDCPKFSDVELKGFIRSYSPENIYRRRAFHNYRRV